MVICDEMAFFINEETTALTSQIFILIVGYDSNNGRLDFLYQLGEVYLSLNLACKQEEKNTNQGKAQISIH